VTGPRYRAGFVTYPGDCRHLVGEVKGPTTYGSFLVAVSAVYDPDADRTRVGFAHLAKTDAGGVERDAFGVLHLAAEAVS
jgi:hypothetical protein